MHVLFLKLVNMTLLGKKIFGDVIKLKILRGDHLILFGRALNPVTRVLIWDGRGENTDIVGKTL